MSEIYLLVAETGHFYDVDETDFDEDRIVRAYRSATIAWDMRAQAETQAKVVFDEVRSKLEPGELYGFSNPDKLQELLQGGSEIDPELYIARSQFYERHLEELPVRYKIKAIKLDER